jgi:hypothetical protein
MSVAVCEGLSEGQGYCYASDLKRSLDPIIGLLVPPLSPRPFIFSQRVLRIKEVFFWKGEAQDKKLAVRGPFTTVTEPSHQFSVHMDSCIW